MTLPGEPTVRPVVWLAAGVVLVIVGVALRRL